jgi:hypothetical protein
MEPLDLRDRHPRPTRAALGGITFLPRSIDKVRALLPGGHANGYTIEGFTESMLEELGISAEAFTDAVATATSDEDVLAFVNAHAAAGGVDRWNEYVLNREVYRGDRAAAIAENPWLADHPEIVKSLDFLQYMEDHGLDAD